MKDKVRRYILEKIDNGEKVLSIVIDPMDYKDLETAVKTGIKAAESGADVVAIGGSTGVQGEILDRVAKEIKENINVPLILFPGNIGTITRHADAIYFLTLLNSRNPYWLSQAQMLGAPVIKRYGVEALATAYIVVEPGGTVGWVGDAKLVPRDKPKIAVALAMTGELSGAHFVFTDAGSASKLGPVPVEMVKAVRKAVDIPYIVAGGIRTTEEARAIVEAGADMIQIGTAVENVEDVEEKVRGFKKAISNR